ncbi:hypothetical protein CSC70_07190 [Pseudoxanthomonas kalamensis DSM 18571]|uniref:hypothetical protein n=1 Tax=Pseudoxanthomonas kalamensis TaxID=289483 RepID=UPI0013917A67|nr:hypothetical protein [Pseudoxanthomonas kalamensis]KAF1710451.1 hypothetical protein CSC70_07190 [Pseudoxanthomonas kalamensis DSM 18571]
MNLWILFFVLLAYAVICQLGVVMQLIKHQVSVPWLTLAVPLHLFQRCQAHRTKLGTALQWWSLSADFAVLTCFVLVLAGWLR